MAVALTYRTEQRKSALRTVICDEVSESIVLLPSGALRVVTAKLLEGTCSGHDFWADVLGSERTDRQFICPADQVVAKREITVAVSVTRRKAA